MSRLALFGGTPVRSSPFPAWPQSTPADEARLLAVLRSGNWGGYPFPNRLADDFARRFAAHHGARYGCCVANGTVAITLALQAAGLRFGDEVIVPAYTWEGTATAVLAAGGVPVFVDVDPHTYCLAPAAAREAVSPRTRALLPVHLAHRFADMDALVALAQERDLLLIEDCAHAHGGQYRHRGAGSWGDAGTFSFQSSKIMAAGEGGIVLTSRLDLLEAVQTLTNCGRASPTDRFSQRPTGGNFRITELQAALLLGQLEQLPDLSERRRRNADRLRHALAGLQGIQPLPPQEGLTQEAIYQFILQYRPGDPPVSRDLFLAALQAEGIPCDGRFYEAVYRSGLFRPTAAQFPQLADAPLDDRDVRCPVAERAAYEEAVWLPHFVLLGDDRDTDDIAAALGKVLEGRQELAGADPTLAQRMRLGRAERARLDAGRNY